MTRITLKASDLKEQFKAAEKYKSLIEKEVAMGDLMDLDNMQKWSKGYKLHMTLIARGYVEI